MLIACDTLSSVCMTETMLQSVALSYASPGINKELQRSIPCVTEQS